MKQQARAEDRTRILFVNHVGQVSGAENSMLALLRHLDDDQFHPRVAVPREGPLASELGDLDIEVEFIPRLRLQRTHNPVSLAAQAAGFFNCRTRLGAIVQDFQPHVIHANSLISALVATTWRFGMPPVIFHARDLSLPHRSTQWAASGAASIVAISECVRKAVIEIAPDEADRVEVIYNGIDTDEFAPSRPPEQVRDALGVSADEILIGNVGQLLPWKKQDIFIRAASIVADRLPEARFVIVGADLFGENPQYVTSLRQLAADSGISERIIWAGYRDDVADLIAAMDVMVHAADREPLGRVIIESLAVGTPCVAVNSAGPAEIIEDMHSGLLTEPTPEALAEGALTIATKPRLAADFTEAGRERISKDFSAADQAQKTQQLYLSLRSREDTRGWGL